jgi:hypothetical protein
MGSIIRGIVTCSLLAFCVCTAVANPTGGLTITVDTVKTIKKQKMVLSSAVPPKVQPKKKTTGKKALKDTTKKQ